MEPLVPSLRRDLRARAHHLHPVVLVGHQGLTPAVLHEIDVALTAHELVKVRLSSDDRHEREALGTRICGELDCAPVQQIGKQLVLWRPRPPPIVTPHAAPGKLAPARGRRGTGATSETAPARGRRGSGATSETAPARRRRAATGALPAGDTPATRRKGPPSKAPTGVPRAAAPRRRRTAG